MPGKARKAAMRKKLKKKVASISSVAALANKATTATTTTTTTEFIAADFLALEGGLARKPPKQHQVEKLVHNATVLYIGRIPHGFYKDEMRGLFEVVLAIGS